MYSHPNLIREHAQALAPTPERLAQLLAEKSQQQHAQAIAQLIAERLESLSHCED
jgi:hypothetical protein